MPFREGGGLRVSDALKLTPKDVQAAYRVTEITGLRPLLSFTKSLYNRPEIGLCAQEADLSGVGAED
jgi:hypothetical protein